MASFPRSLGRALRRWTLASSLVVLVGISHGCFFDLPDVREVSGGPDGGGTAGSGGTGLGGSWAGGTGGTGGTIGGGGAGGGGATGGSAGDGSAGSPPGPVPLAPALGSLAPTALAACGGSAYVATASFSNAALWKVPFDGSSPSELLTLSGFSEINGIFCDASGVVWGGAFGSEFGDGGSLDNSAVGGAGLDGASPWKVSQLFKATGATQYGNAHIFPVAADASNVWAETSNGQMFRAARGCTGDGSACSSVALIDAPHIGDGTCFALSAGSQFLVYLGYCPSDSGLGFCLRRMPALGSGSGDGLFAGFPGLGQSVSCAIADDRLVLVSQSVFKCNSVSGTAPCNPALVSEPVKSYSQLATDGVEFYTSQGGQIQKLHAQNNSFTPVAKAGGAVKAIAADAVAVYWLEYHTDTKQNQLWAIAK